VDFIFMLTRSDQTVEDCMEVMELIAPVGLKHIGFKDVGVPPETLEKLQKAIKDLGAVSYLEVVSETPEAVVNSAKIGRDIGIDRLLGGTDAAPVLEILKGSKTEYYPFPGFPVGHPTKLKGSAKDIEDHCRTFMAQGCAGVDLLAYRAVDEDPLDLIRAAKKGVGSGLLAVAGSINSPERIRAIAEAGADSFTIGGAVFDSSYSPRKGSIRSQLRDVLAACEGL
jgi:hypothetical protein